MEPSSYQKAVMRTMSMSPLDLDKWQVDMCNWCLGLAGEAGEFVDLVKKNIFHGHPHERHNMIEELGDVLWYATAIATHLGTSLDEVMAINVAKLALRYPHGFDADRSVKRDD